MFTFFVNKAKQLIIPMPFVLVKVQDYEVDVSNTMVFRGNIAVLHCIIPSFMRDYLTVTSWLQDRSFHIYPSSDGGKFWFCGQLE